MKMDDTENLSSISLSNLTSGTVNMNNNIISNVNDPIVVKDAANKQYVDTAVGNIATDHIISANSDFEVATTDTHIRITAGALEVQHITV